MWRGKKSRDRIRWSFSTVPRVTNRFAQKLGIATGGGIAAAFRMIANMPPQSFLALAGTSRLWRRTDVVLRTAAIGKIERQLRVGYGSSAVVPSPRCWVDFVLRGLATYGRSTLAPQIADKRRSATLLENTQVAHWARTANAR